MHHLDVSLQKSSRSLVWNSSICWKLELSALLPVVGRPRCTWFPKKTRNWRPFGDFRALNVITVPDRYPLPNIQDFTANLHRTSIISKVDLTKAYHQIPMAEKDICKTAITIPFGLFEFTRMPFGLWNAARHSNASWTSFCADFLSYTHTSTTFW